MSLLRICIPFLVNLCFKKMLCSQCLLICMQQHCKCFNYILQVWWGHHGLWLHVSTTYVTSFNSAFVHGPFWVSKENNVIMIDVAIQHWFGETGKADPQLLETPQTLHSMHGFWIQKFVRITHDQKIFLKWQILFCLVFND